MIGCGLPSSRGTSTGTVSPLRTCTWSLSITMLMTNALPVCRWQFKQWQQCTNIGLAVSRYRTDLQAHSLLSVERVIVPFSFSLRSRDLALYFMNRPGRFLRGDLSSRRAGEAIMTGTLLAGMILLEGTGPLHSEV